MTKQLGSGHDSDRQAGASSGAAFDDARRSNLLARVEEQLFLWDRDGGLTYRELAERLIGMIARDKVDED